jgi:serine/threonine-protein kinase ULK2
LHELRAPNVVSLITATQTRSNYYLIMEYCNGGDLENFIRHRGGHLSEPEAKVILLQIVQGLKDIKDINVMHRDLKLANILINFPSLTKEDQMKPDFDLKEFISSITLVPGCGKECTPIEVKIADLGFARKLNDGELARSYLGTPLIMAPEVLDGNAYDHSADVWSLGCIFYEILVGFSPFTGMNKADLIENITRGTYYFPKTCKLSIAGLSFLHLCLQY